MHNSSTKKRIQKEKKQQKELMDNYLFGRRGEQDGRKKIIIWNGTPNSK